MFNKPGNRSAAHEVAPACSLHKCCKIQGQSWLSKSKDKSCVESHTALAERDRVRKPLWPVMSDLPGIEPRVEGLTRCIPDELSRGPNYNSSTLQTVASRTFSTAFTTSSDCPARSGCSFLTWWDRILIPPALPAQFILQGDLLINQACRASSKLYRLFALRRPP
jgi:hypothetical protein